MVLSVICTLYGLSVCVVSDIASDWYDPDLFQAYRDEVLFGFVPMSVFFRPWSSVSVLLSTWSPTTVLSCHCDG